MRMARWAVVVVVMVGLAGCNRHESLTGSYGAGVVTGQVVMAAGTSASPEGVRVSVVGTGMSTLLGPDGRFRFAGVPDDAELRFTRDDGIDARLGVPASRGSLVIELNGNAAKSGKKRAVPSVVPVEIEGVIKTAGSGSLVITTSHKDDVTVVLTDATVIRHGQTAIAAADLEAGDRVHVKAMVKDDVKTAIEVIVQNEGEGEDDDEKDGEDGATMTANGAVVSVGATSLVVNSVPKGEVTVQVTATTVIRKQGEHITLSEIHAGDEVNAMGKRVDDHTLEARQIEVRGKGKDNGHS
jgi:hypothetical protein